MHLSQNPFCCLCAAPQRDVSFTKVTSESGRREELETLLDKYVLPILLLSKDDKLCVCDTCKTRLIEWDKFINSCKNAHQRLRDSLSTCNQTDLPTSSKSQASNNAVSAIEGSPPKKKKSSNYCIAPWCNNGNYQGISLFRLPKERERALSWLKEAGRSDLNNMKTLRSYYLCAKHFTPDMFTNSARNQLVRTAVPKVFPKAPYADKIALKAAAAKIYPTQFQGVPLKSILPKTSSPKSASSNASKRVAMKPVPIPKLNAVSTSNPTVLHLSSQAEETVSCASKDQNASLIFKRQLQLPTSQESVVKMVSSSHSSQQNNDINSVPQNDKFSIFASSSTLPKDSYNSNTLFCVVKPSNSLISSSAVLEPSSSHAEAVSNVTVIPSKMGTKEQKQYLDELESCFAPDTFNSSTLMTSEVCYLQNVSYKSVVGSQDFLLPHASENVTKSSSFNDQTYCLRSDNSVHASDGSTPSVSSEANPILNHNNELNPPHISIYDLPSDDIQGAETSFINNMGNLDELMDFAKYFEGR